MPSLLQVLHDATGHGAAEIVLESDRAPSMRTALGVESLTVVLSEGELFDALSEVLAPEQQAELAVGNVVEFQLHDGVVRWHLVAEAGEGMVVRGRTGVVRNDVEELGVPLDLPPLRRGDTGKAAAVPRAPGPLARKRDTAWDLPAVSSTSPLASDGASSSASHPRVGTGPRAAASSSASPIALPSWLVAPGAPAPAGDGGPSPESIDFALRRRPPTGEPPAILDDTLDSRSLRPVVDGGSGARANGGDPFVEIARALGEGSLCLVRGNGHGERVARHLGAYALIVDRREAEGRRFDATVATFVVRVEDPSELLGWMLRRVEEGARVIVESGARSAEGARRSLLGVGTGPHAAAWIDAVPRFWCSHDDSGRWSLTRG
jgi:hypothetical protein